MVVVIVLLVVVVLLVAVIGWLAIGGQRSRAGRGDDAWQATVRREYAPPDDRDD